MSALNAYFVVFGTFFLIIAVSIGITVFYIRILNIIETRYPNWVGGGIEE